MSLGQTISSFFETPGGTAVVALFALAALDFALGVLAALRDGTFQVGSLAAWVRKHIAGRVLPITAVLVVGHLAGGLSIDSAEDLLSPGTILTGIGIAAATAYILETIGSVRDSLTPKPGTRDVPQD